MARLLFRDKWLENSPWVLRARFHSGVINAPALVGVIIAIADAPWPAVSPLISLLELANGCLGRLALIGIPTTMLIVCNFAMACLEVQKSLGTWLVPDPWARGENLETMDLKRRVMAWSVFSVCPAIFFVVAALRVLS